MKFTFTTLAAAALTCVGSAHAVEVKYLLWDAMQLPAYKQCAADFEKKNPGTTIKISQSGWDDYWTTISTGFVSGTAPDVFTNHLAKYPEFAKNDQLVDLAPLIQRDKVDTGAYAPGLFDIWGRDSKQYGLPKDWDTIGFVVNMEMAKKAGVTLADLQGMTWNPKDGGSFEQIVRKLSVDASGNNATSPNFDKKKVSVFGYQTPRGAAGMMGQTEWSHFAESNGFKFQDKPWDPKFYYDDPKLVETISYLAGLPGKGLSASFENTKSLGSDAMFVGKKVAIVPQGSWMITYFKNNAKFENAWVPLPTGPTGTRATMFNGLADSIWAGSKVKADAWKWVKYLGSAECQSVVADTGVVFPAIKGQAERAVEVQKAKGVDSSAFLTMAKSKTFLMPIADGGSEIDEVMKSALEAVMMGKADAATALKAANIKVNQLAKK
ncbi:sugar ABC transporter substrate-binding protein [Rhodoferax sp.]|uniref:ABC transporter substrate-binding protein n=1 Tax=Rhodoferax sp. TaxID=50421 RepID=UPI0025DD5F2E|nr:sugar ABC transporter substrate-binding protein [Rhodoferax sp.]